MDIFHGQRYLLEAYYPDHLVTTLLLDRLIEVTWQSKIRMLLIISDLQNLRPTKTGASDFHSQTIAK